MGVAGAGKSLQGHLLADRFNFDYVSTGELIRTQLSPERLESIYAGELLGDQETVEILNDWLNKINDKNNIILDGFPRTKYQIDWLLSYCENESLDKPSVVDFTISEEVVINRLKKRNRKDDNEQTIKKRFISYNNTTRPIIGYMKDNGIKVHTVDADQSPDDVHNSVVSSLGL